MQVAEQTLHANGLAHHVVTWTPESPKATLLLAHGFLDLAWSWKPVAERLASERLGRHRHRR